ncbi:MAG: tRNA (guanine(6)-N2)-methyltransferase [Candidatus Jordarchaeales archaeon]
MFTVFATTAAGIEDLAAKEAQEITGRRAHVDGPGRIAVSVDKIEEAIKLLYLARLIKRVTLKLAEASLSGTKEDLKIIYEAVQAADFTSYLTSNDSFAVRSKRVGAHEYTSIDVARVVGQAVIDRVLKEKNYRQRVNLDEPDVIFRSYVLHDRFYFALDLTGDTPLEKRGYRTELIHPAPLSPVIAAAMLKLVDWNGTRVLLDPMCGLGTIVIEAACMARGIPSAYLRKRTLQVVRHSPFPEIDLEKIFDELDSKIKYHEKPQIIGSDIKEKYVESAKKHARAVMVHDTIDFRVKRLEDYMKDEQGSFDLIVVNPPYGLRVGHPKNVETIYSSLFKVARHILSDDGSLCLITPHTKLVKMLSSNEGLTIVQERWVKYGNLDVRVFVCKK